MVCYTLVRYLRYLRDTVTDTKLELSSDTIRQCQRQYDIIVEAADEINDKYKTFTQITLSVGQYVQYYGQVYEGSDYLIKISTSLIIWKH